MSTFANLPEGFPAEGFGGQVDPQTEPVAEPATNLPPQDGGQGEPEPEPQEPNVPDWQKEFGTPEEMYAAYSKTKTSYENIRPQYTKVTQELSKIKKAATEPQAAPNQQEATNVQANPVDIIKQYINEAVAPVAEMKMQLDVQAIVNAHPDFTKYADSVQQILADEPAMWNLRNPLEAAYKIAKSQNIEATLSDAVKDAKADVYADKQLKVIGSGGKAPASNNTPATTEEDQVVANILQYGTKGGGIF